MDGAVSSGQGIRILFHAGSRIVFRLSGTGTVGATLRVYLERFEPADGRIDQEAGEALAQLIQASETIAQIAAFTHDPAYCDEGC